MSGTPSDAKSADAACASLLAAAVGLLIVLDVLIRPTPAVRFAALGVGLVVAALDFAGAVLARRLGWWTFGGLWPICGYPLSMVAAWFCLTAGFCLILSWLPFGWTWLALVVAAAGGGATWDMTIHRRFGVLTLRRGRLRHQVAYWLAFTAFGAALFRLLTRRL